MATLPRELTIAQIMLADEPGFRRMTIAAVIDACARHYGVAPGLILEPDGVAGSPARARWRCISPTSLLKLQYPRSEGISAATTRPSCTPANR
jgi:CTP:molybdopterin cytidylyltransferase MocA